MRQKEYKTTARSYFIMNKMIARILTLLIVFTLAAPLFAIAQDEAIHIKTTEEFLAFSKQCTLDRWSQGKKVVLQANIDLTDTEFSGVPTFGGIFDGNGHTITGLAMNAKGPVTGLFRYLQKGGVIQNLTVQGTVTAEEKSTCAGIVGENRGSVLSSSFGGDIRGGSIVGGIAGINEASGIIGDCMVNGTISAQKYTGGIAGENFGKISACTNQASVNTTASEETFQLENINLENLEESALTPIRGHTDVGGIAGYSSGMIENSKNFGQIGYQHMGYNIGGIAGRQSGYLTGCENHGSINGRKEVGGIVGQMEPYILLQYSPDKLQDLDSELSVLQNKINAALEHADASGDQISDQMSEISGFANNAKDHSKELLDAIADFTDDNVQTINDTSALIQDTIDDLEPAFERIETASKNISEAIDPIKSVLDTMKVASYEGKLSLQAAQSAAMWLREASDAVTDAIYNLRVACTLLKKAVTHGNESEITAAIDAVVKAQNDLKTAFEKAQNAITSLRENLGKIDGLDDFIANKDQLLQALDTIEQSISQLLSASVDGIAAISELRDQAKRIDWQTVQQAMKKVSESVDHISRCFGAISGASHDIYLAFYHLERVDDALFESLSQLQNSVQAIKNAADDFHSTLEQVHTVISELSGRDPIVFTALSGQVRQNTDSLHSAISGISKGMEELNQDVSSTSKQLTQDLRDISGQFNRILHIMVDALMVEERSFEDLAEDTSDFDISKTSNGKVANSRNYGSVAGDVNIGGVTGAMAIEYDLDPEDDINTLGSKSLNFRYETKAVLTECRNFGAIQAKKNCAGGVVGRMDLGTVYRSYGFGRVQSKDGDYVGGVVGFSDATVRESAAKCTLSGNDAVGGIAGKAKKLSGCYALIQIDDTKGQKGAVAGTLTNLEQIKGNWYIGNDLGGIDGVSYGGIAEEISFENAKKVAYLPEEFFRFALTFVVDGKEIASIPFQYGDDLRDQKFPEIPKKDGKYSKWPDIQREHMTQSMTLTAEYYPWITALASNETQGSEESPIVLVEGKFDDKAAVHVEDAEVDLPGSKDAIVKHISLSGTGLDDEDSISLRFLRPKGSGSIKAFQYRDGKWKSLSCKENGSYIKLTMQGTDGIIAVHTGDFSNVTPLVICLIVLIFCIGAFMFCVQKRKKHIKHSKA